MRPSPIWNRPSRSTRALLRPTSHSGFTLIVSGRAGDAIPYLDRSVELSPHDPHLSSIHAIRALGHLSLDELELAESFARKATRIPNANRWPFLVLASLLGLMDRVEEARRALSTLLERIRRGFPWRTLAPNSSSAATRLWRNATSKVSAALASQKA